MKLTLTQIVKNGLKDLQRLYPLVKDHVDEWVVVVPPNDKAIPFLKKCKAKIIEQDFTQPIEPEVIEQMKQWGLEVDPNYRLFNFAAARNASLEAATGDYVLWLDADDEPVGMDNLKQLISREPDIEVFYAVYDYYRDNEGNSVSDHVRERVVKNNGKWMWLGAELGLIHETLLPKPPYEPIKLDVPDDVFRVTHHTDHVDDSSIRNHIALLYEYIVTKGKDARTTYYLGIEFFNRGMFEDCIKVLKEFVQVTGSDEERYYAYVKIAEAYNMLEDKQSSRNAYLAAIDERPSYPHAYLGIGESYYSEEKWAKGVEFMMTGLQKQMPKTMHVVDVTRLTFRPSIFIALSYLQLGKPKQAYEWFLKGYRLNPKHPWVKKYAPLFQDAKDLDEYVSSFVKLGQISQRLYPKTLSKLAEVVPDDLMDQELLMDFKWRYMKPKVWGEKSVTFFCSSAFEDWGPESLEKGCGGSEEAIIQLSKKLVQLGWEVTVYNNCIREGKFDGVEWIRFERFNPRDIFNILVSWRNNTFLDARIANKKFIDLHDVPDARYYQDKDIEDVKLMVKSNYHRTTLPEVKDERFVVIPNGIDLEQFKNPKKVKNSLIWTSSYDRGVEYLLWMWPAIRKAVPDATLDIYYGWSLYDTTPWGMKPEGQEWKARVTELFNQEGVTEHGRVGTKEIAEAYKKADVWAYPTDFPEIDCITATKAVAAGAIPITTSFAAMAEKNTQGVMIDGRADDSKVREEFQTELIALLKDEDRKAELRKGLDASKYSWDEIAKQWDAQFRN